MNGKRMGMSYSIESDKKKRSKDRFPYSLSYFLEAIGGFGENSEVCQTERILQIDLSFFQNTFAEDEYMGFEAQKELGNIDDPDEAFKEYERKSWQNIDNVIASIKEFILRIEERPEFYKQIRYSKLTDSDRETFDFNLDGLGEQLRRMGSLEDLSDALKEEIAENFVNSLAKIHNPESEFPVKNDYISGGDLKKDLEEIFVTIQNLKKEGCIKMRFLYY